MRKANQYLKSNTRRGLLLLFTGMHTVLLLSTNNLQANIYCKSSKPTSSYTSTIQKTDTLLNKKHTNEGLFETIPQFPGGEKGLADYIKSKLQLPKNEIEIFLKGVITAQFIVTNKGKISNIQVTNIQTDDESIDQASIPPNIKKSVIRLIKGMPKWEPATNQDGKQAYLYTLELPFEVKDLQDGPPEYPGGTFALVKYLQDNIRHPGKKGAAMNGKKLIVAFTVSQKGKPIKIKIIQGVSPAFDQEVIRVVETMPRWKPGIENGVPVEVDMVFPVRL